MKNDPNKTIQLGEGERLRNKEGKGVLVSVCVVVKPRVSQVNLLVVADDSFIVHSTHFTCK